MARRILFMLLALAASGAVPARAEDDPACAKFEEPLAYNACLANHGPKATDIGTNARSGVGTNTGSVQNSDGAPAQAYRYRPAVTRSAHASPRAVRSHGRAHMEFRLH